MQGRESKKESNIQQFHMAMRNAQEEYKLQDRELGCEEWISHPYEAKKKEFCKPWETEKPEQGPRGISWKSLKPGALNLNWLGVTDLNARYKGG